MTKDDLLHRIAGMLVDDPEVVSGDWTHVALVVTIAQTHANVTGFCYARDGAFEPAAPANFDTLDVLRELRAAMAVDDATGRAWKTCLLRIARATRKIDVQFEYDDEARWAITRTNRLARAEELRPPA